MMENTAETLNDLLEGMATTEAEVPVATETVVAEDVDVEVVAEEVTEDVDVEDVAVEEVEVVEEDDTEEPEQVSKFAKVLSEKVYPENLKEALYYEQYEERTQRVISKLDDAGLALLSTGVNMGYTVDANNTYVGLKNSQDKLVARVYTIKKGNRLYTFEKKLESILKDYTNGEITCMGKPGVGNTNTYITLGLLNEAQREQILATLDPSN